MNTHLPADTIEARFHRLEKSARRTRVVAALGIFVAFLMGASRPSQGGPEGTSVSAPFTVVNSSGKPILWVGHGSGGGAALEVLGIGGVAVARLQSGVGGSSGQLTLWDGGRGQVRYPR